MKTTYSQGVTGGGGRGKEEEKGETKIVKNAHNYCIVIFNLS